MSEAIFFIALGAATTAAVVAFILTIVTTKID
jgi:hypothetical protein